MFEWQDYDDTPEIAYIHADHLGSVAVMTDDSGDWTVSQDYLPYGEVRVYETNSPDLESRFDFSDKERDTETGLSYFEARYLSTAAGRFVSQDPWEGDLQDPQSLNRYAYSHNNPVNYADPSGKHPVVAFLLGIVECALSAFDVIDTYITLNDPEASDFSKDITVAGAFFGAMMSGGGYGAMGREGVENIIEHSDEVVDVARQAGSGIDNAASTVINTYQDLIDHANLYDFGKHDEFLCDFRGNIDEVFNTITQGAERLRSDAYELLDGTFLKKYTSSSAGLDTIQINDGEDIYKIRFIEE